MSNVSSVILPHDFLARPRLRRSHSTWPVLPSSLSPPSFPSIITVPRLPRFHRLDRHCGEENPQNPSVARARQTVNAHVLQFRKEAGQGRREKGGGRWEVAGRRSTGASGYMGDRCRDTRFLWRGESAETERRDNRVRCGGWVL